MAAAAATRLTALTAALVGEEEVILFFLTWGRHSIDVMLLARRGRVLFTSYGMNTCIVTIIGKQLHQNGDIAVAAVITTAIDKVTGCVVEEVRVIWVGGWGMVRGGRAWW